MSECETAVNPISYLSFDTGGVKRKNIPLTKWLPTPLKDPKYGQFKLKHLNEENLKLTTTTKARMVEAFEKLSTGQKLWDKLFLEESKVTSADGKEIFIEKFRWWRDNPEAKTFVFIHRRVVEKNMTEQRLSKFSVSSQYQLKKNEVLLSMNTCVSAQKAGGKKKPLRNVGQEQPTLTKIKFIVKDIAAENKEDLMPEIKGLQTRFVENFWSFKSFVEGTE